MTWSRTSSSVAAPGATCQVGPSPTARAIRLENVRARDRAALDALLGAMPEAPPWDASVDPSDPVAPLLREAGFEDYARTFAVSRAIDGLPSGEDTPGIRLLTYTNAMAPRYSVAEAAAMADLATFGEMGSPTGYERGEGYGEFTVALRGERIVGFCFAQLPEGIVWWLGVVPPERRVGIGRMLVDSLSRAVRASGGTHLLAEPEDTPDARGFAQALGFRDRGPRELLIRRA